jgi:hypothetical protein
MIYQILNGLLDCLFMLILVALAAMGTLIFGG